MDLLSIKRKYGIVGQDSALDDAIQKALLAARTNFPVMILGESGVGKENFAHIIHDNSPRKSKTFIAINCGAIPDGTIDSELFGHEKGAFTGAGEMHKGYFEKADGGTIFLDEVADLPMSTQVRLLRVLESGEYFRVGASTPQRVDVRIVTATNADMISRVETGKFRSDLYYRLGMGIHIPPLRDRKGDIFSLFTKFATDCATQYKMPQIQLTDDAINAAENYFWPGNIRQLKHVVENISSMEQSREITAEIFQKYIADAPSPKHLPVLVPNSGNPNYEYNHDALISVIGELKHDVDNLKKIVQELLLQQHTATNFAQGFNQDIISPRVIEHKEDIEPNVDTEVQYVDAMPIDNENIEPAEEIDNSLDAVERKHILKILDKYNGNRRTTAEELGISERTLYRKLSDYGLI